MKPNIGKQDEAMIEESKDKASRPKQFDGNESATFDIAKFKCKACLESFKSKVLYTKHRKLAQHKAK